MESLTARSRSLVHRVGELRATLCHHPAARTRLDLALRSHGHSTLLGHGDCRIGLLARGAKCELDRGVATGAADVRLARPLGESLGDGIATAIRSLEPLDASGRPKSGLPYGL